MTDTAPRLRVIDDAREPLGTLAFFRHDGQPEGVLYLGPPPHVPWWRWRERSRKWGAWSRAVSATLDRYEIEYSPFGVPQWATERKAADDADSL